MVGLADLFSGEIESGEMVFRIPNVTSELGIFDILKGLYPGTDYGELAESVVNDLYTEIVKNRKFGGGVRMVSFHYTFKSDENLIRSGRISASKKYRICTNRMTKTAEDIIKELKDELMFTIDNYDFGEEAILHNIVVRVYGVGFSNNMCVNRVTRSKTLTGGNATFIELPGVLKKLRCLLNIQNKDNMCFVWSTLAAMVNLKKNACRVASYRQYLELLNIGSVEFPISFDEINTFAANNKINYRIWEIFMPITGPSLVPVNLSCIFETERLDMGKKTVNLLLYRNHYVLIKNINAFIKFVINVSDEIIVCDYCGSCYFSTLSAYDKHLEVCLCYNSEEYKFKLTENSDVGFRNVKNKYRCGIVIYGDTESILKPINVKFGKQSEYVNEHQAIAIGCVLKAGEGDIISEHSFYGQDCCKEFIEFLRKDVVEMSKRMYRSIIGSGKIKRISGACIVCNKRLIGKSVESRNPIFGENVTCHCACFVSLSKHLCRSVKVFFHNLKGYDSHFLVDEIAKQMKNIGILLKSKEKGIAITAWCGQVKITFLDSMSFLLGSLDSLSSRLSEYKWIGNKAMKSNLSLDVGKNCKGKQCFPYEYVKSIDILENERLPTETEAWYSSLKKSTPSRNEIEGALKVFDEMGFRNIKEYMMFYLRIDVLLLLEVFEEFRVTSLNNYGLDPCHYFTTPGLAWDAAMKFTGEKLELLKSEELVRFFSEKGVIRGGVSTVSEVKWAEEDGDSSIFYYDVTNLYGFAMCQPLPVGEFSWVYIHTDIQKKELNTYINIDPLDLLKKWTSDYTHGYVFEVDIETPKSLHDKHTELPFLPESYNGRLSATLLPKVNYRVHVSLLQQAVANGLEIKMVHRVLQFRQKAWLKPYIEFNAMMRGQTSDENQRNFFKLMNNAVYGKTMENVFKRSKLMVISKHEEGKIQKLIRNSSVQSFDDFTDNMMIGKRNVVPVFDKPVYIGFAILELSKKHMYFLLYDVVKVKWPASKLMYMDTDSFIINFNFKYGEMEYNGVERYFDLAGYKNNNELSKCYSDCNKGVLGTLKDEYSGDKIKKFVCLRSKCYTLMLASGKTVSKNKGDSDAKELNVQIFEDILSSKIKSIQSVQTNIRSFNHKVFTVSANKETINDKIDLKRKQFINERLNGFKMFQTKAIGHYTNI